MKSCSGYVYLPAKGKNNFLIAYYTMYPLLHEGSVQIFGKDEFFDFSTRYAIAPPCCTEYVSSLTCSVPPLRYPPLFAICR